MHTWHDIWAERALTSQTCLWSKQHMHHGSITVTQSVGAVTASTVVTVNAQAGHHVQQQCHSSSQVGTALVPALVRAFWLFGIL